MLESQAEGKLRNDSEALPPYAAQLEPERKHHTNKPTVQDQAFGKEMS